MGSILIRPCVINPIYYLSNSSCSKVKLNIEVRMYGSFGPTFLSKKSISSSHYLTLVYQVWSCLGARTISLTFDTQQITTVNVVFGNSGRLLRASLIERSPKSIVGFWLTRLPFSLPPEFCLHITSKPSQPTATKSIQHYRNYAKAASPQMSPSDLQLPCPSEGVHLEAVSNGSVPR